MPRTPPEHSPVLIRPTPEFGDVLFYVEADGKLPTHWTPERGSPYSGHDADRFPDHKLVFVAPQTPERWERHYYAADRENQDLYNFEHTLAGIGGAQFDAISRSYVIPRDDYDSASPAMGAVMADEPAGMFTGTYILSERKQARIGVQELDSLYVAEVRTYVARTTIASVEHEETLGIGVGSVITLYYLGEIPAGSITPIEDLVLAPGDAYWSVQEDGTIRTGRQITANWFAVTTRSSLDDALLDYLISYPSTVDLRLPAVLDSISVVWSSSAGNGSYSADWTGIATGTSKHLSGAESGDAQGSAGVQPELVIHITKPEGNDIPSMAYVFFAQLTADSFSEAALLARLTTLAGGAVTRWPHFRPRSHTLILQGAKVAVQARASANASYADTSDSHSEDLTQGSGTSIDVALSVTAVNLPETIHGAITITGATNTAAASATAEVGWTGWGGFPSASASATLSSSAAGSVSPTSLSATSPSSIPSSGLYLAQVRIEPHSEFGWVRVYAEVINAASLTL